jgi:hypothetical protein
MTTRYLDVVDFDHAFSTRFAAGRFLTRMIAWLMPPLAGLFALKCSVHGLRMTTCLTSMSTVKTIGAWLPASTFRAEFCEIARFSNVHDRLRMARATQPQRRTNGITCTQHTDHLLPHSDGRVGVSVTDEIHAVLGSTEEHVDAIRYLEESDVPFRIAAHKGDNDDFSLFTLEVVDCGHSR